MRAGCRVALFSADDVHFLVAPAGAMGGKNPGKAAHQAKFLKAGGGGDGEDGGEGGGGGGGMERDFHSQEFANAEMDRLLNPVERPTWDQFKEQLRKKGELEGAEAKADEEAQRVRAQPSVFCRECTCSRILLT